MARPVDFEHWNQMPKAKLWECILLSIGRDPLDADFNLLEYSLKQLDWEKYSKRLLIAEANLSWDKGAPLSPIDGGGNGKAFYTMSLPDFIDWARGMNWDVPSNLSGFVIPSLPAKEIVSPAPMKEKERGNLLRIIGALYTVIKGNDGFTKHPDFSTQSDFIQRLEKLYADRAGLSKSNLEKVLPQATSTLNEIENPK